MRSKYPKAPFQAIAREYQISPWHPPAISKGGFLPWSSYSSGEIRHIGGCSVVCMVFPNMERVCVRRVAGRTAHQETLLPGRD